jgi:serine/threonine protein kinase
VDAGRLFEGKTRKTNMCRDPALFFWLYLSNIYQLTFPSPFDYYRLKDLPAVEREAAANEVRVLASVVSPQIIKYYDAFVENSRLFIGSWGDANC